MQLIGKNLKQILEINGNFSIKTVCLLAIQMISILEHIHNKGVIHRDIKPENFVLGKENESNYKHLYLIDFGFSKFFDKNGLNDIVTNKKNLIDKVFFKKYRCLEYIGEGSFSQIFKVEYNNNLYAIKLENINNKQNLLSNEASMMIYLKGPNIPYIVTYGSSGGYNLIVMQLLGKYLQQICEINCNLCITTVCLLSIQMISQLEYRHNIILYINI